MLFDTKVDISLNEFESFKVALAEGVRPDQRKFDEARKLSFQQITMPGVATVHLGTTVVSAVTTARLITPSENSPMKGMHNIYLFSDIQKGKTELMQTYFRFMWSNARILEEESLCVKAGEKVWALTTRLVVHDDDSGIFEAGIAAIIASLSTLRFPSFDSNSGLLFSPTSRRVHRIALSSRPICVTIGFTNGKNSKTGKHNSNLIIVDPSRIEQQVSRRFATFIFDENLEQIFLDSYLPGDLEEAYNTAREIAKEWKRTIDTAIDNFKPDNSYCVGEPHDFAGYEPPKFIMPPTGEMKRYKEIEVWYGTTKSKYVLDLDIKPEIVEKSEKNASNEGDWLFSSLN
jgi:exosome complex component RRP45